MPYETKICSSCQHQGEYFHNRRVCTNCGEAKLIAPAKKQATQIASLTRENKALRKEVNELRRRLGIGVKYVEYDEGSPS